MAKENIKPQDKAFMCKNWGLERIEEKIKGKEDK